jgi:hypothetical protein
LRSEQSLAEIGMWRNCHRGKLELRLRQKAPQAPVNELRKVGNFSSPGPTLWSGQDYGRNARMIWLDVNRAFCAPAKAK